MERDNPEKSATKSSMPEEARLAELLTAHQEGGEAGLQAALGGLHPDLVSETVTTPHGIVMHQTRLREPAPIKTVFSATKSPKS